MTQRLYFNLHNLNYLEGRRNPGCNTTMTKELDYNYSEVWNNLTDRNKDQDAT